MAKVAMIERDIKRKKMAEKYQKKRDALNATIHNKEKTNEERFTATLELAKLPRNSARVRQRNRCGVTGRPRGVFRKFNLSRNLIRQLASSGILPGVTKSSW